MGYDNKKDEQRAIDAWLDGKFSIYSLVMAMIEFQKTRRLQKTWLYYHSEKTR